MYDFGLRIAYYRADDKASRDRIKAILAIMILGLGMVGLGICRTSAEEAGRKPPPRGVRVHRCLAGDEACPVVLKMKPGTDSIEATGSVSGEHPNYYFKFDARAGQKATIHIVGGNIKTGPGIPITLPNGGSDAIDEGSPFTLPETGTYILLLHANTMAEGPFGRFRMKLRIE
jgi:hypothetical protein